jgi:hypothetical protein
MAKYINECSFYVPVERLGEGTYLYGTKKIFAKIMNGKLIIRVGGGYMVIDEFLKQFEQELTAGNWNLLTVDAHHQLPHHHAPHTPHTPHTPHHDGSGKHNTPPKRPPSPNHNKAQKSPRSSVVNHK